MNDAAETPTEAQEDGWEWVVLEIMGHRRHAGRAREVEKFGAKFLRIDVPIFSAVRNEDGSTAVEGDVDMRWETRFYSGPSIFSVSYTDEASVMRANKPYVSPYRITARVEEDDPEIPFDDEDDQ